MSPDRAPRSRQLGGGGARASHLAARRRLRTVRRQFVADKACLPPRPAPKPRRARWRLSLACEHAGWDRDDLVRRRQERDAVSRSLERLKVRPRGALGIAAAADVVRHRCHHGCAGRGRDPDLGQGGCSRNRPPRQHAPPALATAKEFMIATGRRVCRRSGVAKRCKRRPRSRGRGRYRVTPKPRQNRMASALPKRWADTLIGRRLALKPQSRRAFGRQLPRNHEPAPAPSGRIHSGGDPIGPAPATDRPSYARRSSAATTCAVCSSGTMCAASPIITSSAPAIPARKRSA